MIYFTRHKLIAGEYLLFYRAAWNGEFNPNQPETSMHVEHSERKLVVSINMPAGSQIEVERLSARSEEYGKETFL